MDMYNAYIIDAIIFFLYMAFMLLGCLGINKRLRFLSAGMTPGVMELAIGSLYKRALVLSTPLLVTACFSVWRFYALLVTFSAIGAGGFGLIAVLLFIGIFESIAYTFLFCVVHSGFAPTNTPTPHSNQTPNHLVNTMNNEN